MKAIFAALALIVSAQAHAQMDTGIALSTIKSDGNTLEVSYRTGGGCKKHSADAVVSLAGDLGKVEGYRGRNITAKVEIVDRTNDGQFDPCEALIGVSGTIDLKAVVQKALQEKGLDLTRESINLQIELPKLEVRFL